MSPKDIPNLISLFRIFLTLPVIYALLERQFWWAMIGFAIAGVSDALDGFLAKHHGWQSHLGGLLDPIADKVLLVSALLVLGGIGLLPTWLVVLAVLRDLVIVGGALVYHYRIEELRATPSRISKFNTFLQITLVLATVAHAGPLPWLTEEMLTTLIWVTTTAILWSGMDYVWAWSRRATRKGWKRPESDQNPG
ncbi:MAG: CDP-alcohol phosphatidyltransferase family protein [Pseudomonadota bacterium]